MPLYFAYGSNMDEAAIRGRCPKARTLGTARLARHRFVLMGNGWASVRRDPHSDVHGVLIDLALSDVGSLDRYEDVGAGLYTKTILSVIRDGAQACRALIYVGTDETTGGVPAPGYMEGIAAAARAAPLPSAYVVKLERLVPTPRTGARP